MRNLSRIIALLIVLVFSITVAGCGSKTVAKVNGEKITQADLDKRMKKIKMSLEQQGASFTGQQGQQMLKALEQQTLDEMITQTLIIQAAKKEGVNPSNTEVKKSVDEIIASFGGEKKFNEALKTYNYTMKEIEELKSFDIARTKLFDKVTADVKVTDADIKQWYDTQKQNYKDPAKIKAKSILIKFDDPSQAPAAGEPAPKVGRSEQDAKKLAEDIIKRLDKGEDFAKLAKEKSEDDRTKSDGGQIKDTAGSDTYSKGTLMSREFDDAAVALKVGSYSKTPVKTRQGYVIIKLEGLTPEKQQTFEEAKAKIQQELPATRKQQKFVDYITELRNKAKVVNNLAKEAPPASPQDSQQLPPGHPSTSTQTPETQK
ncbi:MAG: SurA N-terminal domain-containing protein [Eubacteriales bacterium]